jgi:choline kinase
MIIRQIEQLTNWGLDEFIVVTNPSFDELIKMLLIHIFLIKKLALQYNMNKKVSPMHYCVLKNISIMVIQFFLF